MRNVVIAVIITAVVSVAATLIIVRPARGIAGMTTINDAVRCRDALVEVDVLCQSMSRSEAGNRVDRLLATPDFYRCGDPRWHNDPGYAQCFAVHERAKQLRTALDEWWSAHPDQPPDEH